MRPSYGQTRLDTICWTRNPRKKLEFFITSVGDDLRGELIEIFIETKGRGRTDRPRNRRLGYQSRTRENHHTRSRNRRASLIFSRVIAGSLGKSADNAFSQRIITSARNRVPVSMPGVLYAISRSSSP